MLLFSARLLNTSAEVFKMFYLPKTDVGISIVLKYSCQGTAEVEVRSGFFDRWAAQLTFPASSCISDAVD